MIVDPQLLFQRLTTVATNLESKEDVFKYELTTVPAALFDSLGHQRQANKASLGDYLWTICDHSATVPCGGTVCYVLDGGSLLHRVTWPQDVTYADGISEYVSYIKRRYCNATIVFDGYDSGPSIKDVTHNRRSGRVAPDIDFSGNMRVCVKMEPFLSNGANKQRLIKMLIRELRGTGYGAIQASDDADVLIVQTTLQIAETSATVLIGEDTDLLVLLLQHTPISCHDVFFVPGRTNASTKATKIWHIQRCQVDIGPRLCHNMLFAHAIGGCDTTARLYGIGKNIPLKRLSADDTFVQIATNFYKEDMSAESIATAGERLLVSIYGGNRDETLDHLRYSRFARKVATTKTAVLASSLPPTSCSAKYHSFRAYYQIRQWMDIGNDSSQATVTMDPLKWGWKLQNGQLVAITTDMPAAPDGLLRVVRCNCKTDCSTARCSCRKHGLQCSACCGDCRGTSCTNGVDLCDVDSSTEDD